MDGWDLRFPSHGGWGFPAFLTVDQCRALGSAPPRLLFNGLLSTMLRDPAKMALRLLLYAYTVRIRHRDREMGLMIIIFLRRRLWTSKGVKVSLYLFRDC